MGILLFLMALVSSMVILVPVLLPQFGILVPDYINSIIGAYIGAIFAVIGSIIFQRITDDKKNKQLVQKKIELLQNELYNNYLVAMKVITTSEIAADYSKVAFNKYLEDGDTINDFGEIEFFQEVSNLYFIIGAGSQFFRSFNEFYEETFIKNKKIKSDFFQVYNILQSIKSETIYEFAIIYNVIRINNKFELGLSLPFENYAALVEYQLGRNLNESEYIHIYFAELIFIKLQNKPGKVNFSRNACEPLLKNAEELLNKKRIDEKKEIAHNKDFIALYIAQKMEILTDQLNLELVQKFLVNINKDIITVEHDMYKTVIEFLKDVVMNDIEVYLSFVGIKANEDAIDNYGRSRQQEFISGISKEYVVSEREWYIEMLEHTMVSEEPVITMPYIDTSGSYVLSIVKSLKNSKDQVIGAFGLDILMINIFSKLNCLYHTMIITHEGEIVFNSSHTIKEELEGRHNLNYILEPFVLDMICKGKKGVCESKMYGETKRIVFDNIINDKYYILKLSDV